MDWPVQAGAIDDVLHEMDLRLRRRRRRRIGTALGGIAALVLMALVGNAVLEQRRSEAGARASVAIVALPARQVLSDGSVVELKEGAEIALAYTADFRRVTLVRGAAHFQVTKDPRRPFVVLVGGVEVCAVGTAFSVHRGATAVEVLVTEGRVAVEQVAPTSSPTSPAPEPLVPGATVPAPVPRPLALLDAGHRLIVAVSAAAPVVPPAVQILSEQELRERLAWRVPRLEFSATPLTLVAEKMNQHNRVQLVVSDPEIANVHLSGTLRTDDLDTLLRLLEEVHGIKAHKRGETELVLGRPR